MSGAEWQALRVSLLVTSVATVGVVAAGLPLAWVLARRRFPGRELLDGLVSLPLVLPPVVTGFALLWLLSPQGWLGQLTTAWWGDTLLFRWPAASLAAGVVAMPLFVRTVRTALEAVDPGLERAATGLGASPGRVARTVVLPLARPGLVAGTGLAFGRALGEFGATILVAGNLPGQTQTIPLAIFSSSQTGDLERILPLVGIVSAVSFVAVVVADRAIRRAR